jgi:hypothetical protein
MLGTWVLAGTAALGHIWLARPELGPQVPPAVSLWLIELYGSTNGEELRDLETLLALGSALVVVLALTFAGLFVFRRYAHRPTS